MGVLDQSTETRISVHEAVCVERYNTIIERLTRLEKIVSWGTRTMLAALLGLFVMMLFKDYL